MSMTHDRRIFTWLPGYMALLNLAWEPEGLEHHMTEVSRAAKRLAGDPAYCSTVIRDDNWRFPLAGCACLLASKNRNFFPDLCSRFSNGSMVVPQIATTLGLLHPGEARDFLKTEIAPSQSNKSPSRVVSAQTVLVRLGVLKPSEISLTGWSSHDQDYATMAERVVDKHWSFWSARFNKLDQG